MRCAMRWLNPARSKLRLVVTRNALDRWARPCLRPGSSPRSPIRASFPSRSTRAPSTRARRLRCARWTGAGWRMWRLQKGRARRASCCWTGCRTRTTWARSCARPRFSAPARWWPRASFRPRDRRAGKDRERCAGTPALPARAQPRQRDRDAQIHGLPCHRSRRGGSGRDRWAADQARDRPAALVLGQRGRACAHARVICAMCWRGSRLLAALGRSTSQMPPR
jgi:hypothetical protein